MARRCVKGVVWGAICLSLIASVAAYSGQRSVLNAAQAHLRAQEVVIANLQGALADAYAHAENIALVASRLEQERASAADFASGATREVRRLHRRIAALTADARLNELTHRRTLRRIEAAARRGLSAAERTLAITGVSREDLMSEIERTYAGEGGGISDSIAAAAQPHSMLRATGAHSTPRESRLADDLDYLADLRFALRLMPFGEPVRTARVTSDFGPRRDPFHRRNRMHNGVDLASSRGAPIHAAGPGKVIFSGWMRGYGQVVKIGHAFGFETVYAHLHQRRVSVGDRVEQGSHIGDMGSTGRSTGVHLHYEIRLNGVAVNPVNYIEAARHVL